MKLNTLILTVLLTLLVSPDVTRAQSWTWGRGNTSGGMDGWPVAVDPQGNVFGGGITFANGAVSFGSFTVPGTSAIHLCAVITKYDQTGNFLWARGTENGDAFIINIATDGQGNSFMLGSFSDSTLQLGSHTLTNIYAHDVQYFLAKYDPSGNILWVVSGGNAQFNGASIGGISSVLSTGGIATDAMGNSYITVNFHQPNIIVGSNTITNAGAASNSNDILVVKYDPSGNLVWAKSFGGTGDDDAYGITVTQAGDIYLDGVYNSPALHFGPVTLAGTALGTYAQSAFIARLNSSGIATWAAASGGIGGEYAVGIASDGSGNVYLTGGLKDDSISFAGTTITNPTPGKAVLYLVKFDPLNNVNWHKIIKSVNPTSGSAGHNNNGAWGYSIAMSQCGVIWVSGAFSDSIDIDGHIITPAATGGAEQPDPVFIAGYTASGTYVGSAGLSSGGDDQNGIACDAAGNVYMCSDYWSNYALSIGGDALPVDSAAGELMYIARFNSLNHAVKLTTSSKIICGDATALEAPEGYQNYSWSNGGSGRTEQVQGQGVYWVTSSDSCVSFSIDTFNVASCGCEQLVFVPNSFTPNGDGHNDVFYPRCSAGIGSIESFRVYDRWGELLFDREHVQINDKTNAWDGTFNGQKPLPEVYVWIVDGKCSDGSKFSKKGSVTIIK
jgi:gliding motility-associated-like protein